MVNAAGAWADSVTTASGAAPAGIIPYRRTMARVQFAVPTPAAQPLVSNVGGDFYFRGEAEGRIWLRPHDGTPSAPCDAAPEEIDVALAIERLQKVVKWPVAAVELNGRDCAVLLPIGSQLLVRIYASRIFLCTGQASEYRQLPPYLAF